MDVGEFLVADEFSGETIVEQFELRVVVFV